LSQNDTNSDEFYSRFHDQLLESQAWPGTYMFKFVIKSESLTLDKLKSYFDNKKAKFSEKLSSKKNFTSLTIKVKMVNAHEVISIYKKASQLEGIMAL
jgi:putative lipoic acid-binding regulatory protein|tara:strand:+ start:19433 stop:19726 length:294 start_codon:yes stop_codon:yes gene_type:complete